MRQQLRAAAIACFAAALFAAGSAQAAFIAGWDFTQYAGAGTFIVNGTSSSETLRSNYSDFDPSFGAGGDSQPFGTMYMDGSNGSTNITGITNVITVATSLIPNLTTPGDNDVPSSPQPDEPFDTSTGVLQVAAGNYNAGTGQSFRTLLKMRALTDVSIVFEARVSSLGAGYQAENWEIAFAANTNGGAGSTIGIEWSEDASLWNALASEAIDSTAELVSRTVSGGAGDNVFFRLTFDSPGATGAPQWDNVTISGDVSLVPEPGTAALLFLGLTGLGVMGRRRA